MTVLSTDTEMLDAIPGLARKVVRVFPSADMMDPAVKEALACLAPVQFASCGDHSECGPGDAIIVLSSDGDLIAKLLRTGVHSFHIPSGVPGSPSADGRQTIQFANSPHLDARFRGRCLSHKILPNQFALKVEQGDEVLASHTGKPDWVFRKRNGGEAHMVSTPLPKMQSGDLSAWHLSGENFISLLPLVHFLRELTADSRWKGPPPMACMIVDDPNLHWVSYGFIGFDSLLVRVKQAGAHVAFATIPLDAWGFHPATVRLFRENQKEFSLLYHGNDHTKWELAQNRTRDGWLSVFAQGMSRIAHLEERTGLHVARVMVPPHEGYSAAALLALAALGFEGACFPLGMVRRWNAGMSVRPAYGLEMAEWFDGPLPVLSRFNLLWPSCQGEIIISAFLNRPIIIVGHHDTFAKGYEALDSAIATINSLKDVQWLSPSAMLNRSYLTWRENHSFWIKPYARRVKLTVPEDVTKIRAILPENVRADVALNMIVRNTEGKELRRIKPGSGEAVEVQPGQGIDIHLMTPDPVDYRQLEHPGLSYRALARRILCEGRDRLSPFLAKLNGR
jgi:hypothetical protein